MNTRKILVSIVVGSFGLAVFIFLFKSGSANGGKTRGSVVRTTAQDGGALIRDPLRSGEKTGSSEFNRRNDVMRVDLEPDERPASTKFAISPSGILPSFVAAELGLSDKQYMGVQAALTRFRRKNEESVAARALYDESLSEPSKGKDVYRIPALPDSGAQIKEEFMKDLEAQVGAETAKLLWPDVYDEPFGGYGKYDVLVEFSPNQEFIDAGLDSEAVWVKVVYTNPKTGSKVLEGGRSLERFSEVFGNWAAKKE